MFRIFSLAVVVAALGLACSSADKKTDAGAATDAVGTESGAITDKAMDFDIAGSDSGKIQGLSTINFDYDKATLTSTARKTLADNAEWIKGHANATVQIEGHCDSRGSVEYNLALGERRAKSVKGYLVSLGIDAKRLSIISYGKEKPLDSADTEEAYARNRRANFLPLPQ
jgi:peptidoglycan-associated lipoprotein